MNKHRLLSEYIYGRIKCLLYGKNKILSFPVNGRIMRMPGHSFIPLFKHIFLDRDYELPKYYHGNLKILDIGANVGMSTWFYKSLNPECEIDAIEADPEIFKDLQNNLNTIENCRLHNFAVWDNDGSVQFSQTGKLGGKIKYRTDSLNKKDIEIPAVDLSKWLKDKTYDVIKIDIEGAEKTILPHAFEEISRAKIIIFEWHVEQGVNTKLHDILKAFSEKGFNYYIRAEDRIHNPLIADIYPGSMEIFSNRLIIYCWNDLNLQI